jgi:PEP-CTERM motif
MKQKQQSLSFGRLLILCLVANTTLAQGTFENLDFEDATIAPTPVGGSTYPADPAQAFPGWTVGGSGTVVMYNDLSIGAPAAVLMGPNFPNYAGYTPLQGSYSVLLQYFGIAGGPPTLSQTGLVPADAQSISVLVPSGENVFYPAATVVTLNGINIPLVAIAGDRIAGNISAFAGTVSQLTISTINSQAWLYFDDIQFSSSAVPEPSTLALLGLCGFLVVARRRLRI